MLDDFIIYNFKEENKNALIFLPGYTGGLNVPLLKGLIEYYSLKKDCDVLGLDLEYEKDSPDLYTDSQKRIIGSVSEFVSNNPQKTVILIAKSLGSSLCIMNTLQLKIKGIVALGFPVVLGWPQRISLLSKEVSEIPDYISEWTPILAENTLPTKIINGDMDDLTDNKFLADMVARFQKLNLTILHDTNHDLSNRQTSETHLNECIDEIDVLLEE